jgi:hypothetical protein
MRKVTGNNKNFERSGLNLYICQKQTHRKCMYIYKSDKSTLPSAINKMGKINVSIVHSNAFEIKADTLILKYAQELHGLDRSIVYQLNKIGLLVQNKLPGIGNNYFIESHQITNTKNILFIGTPELIDFNYSEIRTFGKSVLPTLTKVNPTVETVLMTIHGPGYGLDETEAFKSLLAGLMDSINEAQFPVYISEIIFSENDEGRVQRLQSVLNGLFPDKKINTESQTKKSNKLTVTAELFQMPDHYSASKKRVFVAMPFAPEFDDHFHYGIQGAVNASGYLCERADLSSYTGDVMEWVKSRISSADFVIADLTTANPNVYLEIGYAWGLNKKTILLIKDTDDLRFDTRGQRCLPYSSIKDMETKLKNELIALNI